MAAAWGPASSESLSLAASKTTVSDHWAIVASCTAGAPPGAAGPSQASPGRAREGRCHCQSDSRPVEPRSRWLSEASRSWARRGSGGQLESGPAWPSLSSDWAWLGVRHWQPAIQCSVPCPACQCPARVRVLLVQRYHDAAVCTEFWSFPKINPLAQAPRLVRIWSLRNATQNAC